MWRNSPALQERVSIAHGVPDVALAGLYGRAMFTVTNSFYEGWGLPITESLSFGRIPLVARNTSLTEAGGDAAVYFESDNLPDLVARLESLIFDPAERERLEAVIRDTVSLRSWGDIADQVMRVIAARNADGAADGAPPVLVAPAVIYPLRLTGGGAAERSKAMADIIRDGLGWHPLENWGCWTRQGLAKLRLPIDPAVVGGRMRVYLGCVVPVGASGIRLRAFGSDAAPGPFLRLLPDDGSNGRFACVLDCEAAGADLIVEIDGGRRHQDRRHGGFRRTVDRPRRDDRHGVPARRSAGTARFPGAADLQGAGAGSITRLHTPRVGGRYPGDTVLRIMDRTWEEQE